MLKKMVMVFLSILSIFSIFSYSFAADKDVSEIVLEVERSNYGHANVVFLHHGEKGVDNIDDWLPVIEKASKDNTKRVGIHEY